ncbi:MAG: hypothetical protein KA143_01100 [Saprospiraceae bacterium]|nr:hypothetical protein [Saprospiraceae bacterium]
MKPVILFIVLSISTAVYSQKTADEVIAKVIAAQGGYEKLKAIQTMKLLGTLEIQGQKIPYNTYQIHDKVSKSELTFNGLQQYQIIYRDSGFVFSAFQGMTAPERMTPEDIKQGQDGLDLQGVLVDYAKKGHSVELLEPEDVDGVDAIQVKVNLNTGKTQFYFIDPDNYYPIRIKTKGISNGQEYTNVTDYYNFKATSNGIILPHTIGNLSFDNIEINVPIDQKIFEIKRSK